MDWIDELGLAWRREYPGVDTSTLPPLARLARLSILIEGFQCEVLEAFDLSAGDYGVLAVLRRAGAPYRVSPSDLTSRLSRSSGGITKILKRLEARGLIERSRDPADGRGTRVRLTRSGRALQERVFHAYVEHTQKLLAPVPASRLQQSDRALRVLLEAFEAHRISAEEST